MATRPRPKVLLIHDGAAVDAHVKHLTNAGIAVFEVHGAGAVGEAIRCQPDIIILDFACAARS